MPEFTYIYIITPTPDHGPCMAPSLERLTVSRVTPKYYIAPERHRAFGYLERIPIDHPGVATTPAAAWRLFEEACKARLAALHADVALAEQQLLVASTEALIAEREQ